MRLLVMATLAVGCADESSSVTPSGAESALDSFDSGEAAPSQSLLITEILADNHDVLLDADGDSSDWIELYNPGPGPVSLAGWAMGDGPDDLHDLPDVTLAQGEFRVVFASGKMASADPDEIHVPFRLSADGEAVALRDDAGRWVDQVEYPAQTEDVSWGRPQAVESTVAVQDGSPARFSLGEQSGWTEPEHDDSGWSEVILPIGFDVVDGSTETVNLALFAETAQSSDGYGFTGVQAVDGESSTFSHTGDGDLDPWWQVDLGTSSHLQSITVLNRVGCCPERLYNITIEVLDEAGVPVWSSERFNPVDEGGTPSDPGGTLDAGLEETVSGRFVKVSKTAVGGEGSSEWLSLAEAQVLGVEAAPYDQWILTDIGDVMRDTTATAWVRVPLAFGLDPDRLTLDVFADDGFEAWLDGVSVAASPPEEGVELTESQRFALDPRDAGVLAVALQNIDAADPDALLGITLSAQSIDTDTDTTAWFSSPTPGEPNDAGLLGLLQAPLVQPERGFYDGPFTATLSSDGAIVYTLDGTEPTLDNGVVADEGFTEIEVTTTTVLRAVAIADGWGDSDVVTHSWLFLDDVVRQSAAPDGLPTVWDGLSQSAVSGDYEMDPEVVDDPAYADDLMSGLRAIPTMSVVTDPDGLWSGDQGIYINSLQRGSDWERQVSVEYILPDGTTGFAVQCGLRVHGYGWRYHSNTKKHSFRLEFRDRYGPRKLDYPLFEGAPVERFDSIVLRSQGSRGWQDFRDPEQAQYIRDAFARDTALAMGKDEGHATYVHLYLNGLYWGLYMPVERPDADFGAERFGGEAEEYDAINRRTSTNEAIDGTLDAYYTLLSLADQDLSVQANMDAVEAMIDVDDLIDYMLIHQYTVNRDGPEEYNHNNMRGVRRRLDGERFRFFVWDMEYSIWDADDNYNIDVDVAGSASHVYARMRDNESFRQRYAERARTHLEGGGALTPDAAIERWEARAAEIEDAIVAESARWGDTDRAEPYTRDAEWETEHTRLITEFFPYRTGALIEQLSAAGLYEE